MTTEVERARLHQQQARARANFRITNACRTLAGSVNARIELARNWRPLWDRTTYIDDTTPSDVVDDIIIDE